ncbi:MAG TPA: Slp family lipoprotein [Frateuria sp.]|uniref:Slp family lipoprotein n=1 Tax=Frateuria sp. TaxID=2211372 RepID=UPI002D7E5CAA|nr:Slp family lipoprotein [Frateuria sp.]HET6804588.1 Slp family lipoprotein [Frateuria sp.]
MRFSVASIMSRCLVPAVLLSLAACAPAPIYKPAPDAVTVAPFQVAQSPEQFASRQVIWGGRIVGVTNLADHSEVEILAYPLDKSQRPQANDSGNGRFIAVMPGYVESLDYPAGGLITVNGQLHGSRAGKVGQAGYVFPLVQVNQAHVWTTEEMRKGKNNVHFGLGVGVGIR